MSDTTRCVTTQPKKLKEVSMGQPAANHRLNLKQVALNPASAICEDVTCTETSGWKVRASDGALNTSNPIREIIETMNLAENPDKKVIPLSIGDPTIFGNLKPCKEILDSIQKANASGKYYGYQTAAGMEVARSAVADYHHRCTGNRVRPQDVILASGCSHAIDLCICVLARHGQNILIPRPGFPLYKTLTSVYGVRYKQYNLIAEKNWSVDLKHLESLIDADTAAIVINNPSNPCGSVFSERHLKQILRVAEKHRLPIISDEIYDKFVFSPDVYDAEQARSPSPMDTELQSGPLVATANGHVQANIENEKPHLLRPEGPNNKFCTINNLKQERDLEAAIRANERQLVRKLNGLAERNTDSDSESEAEDCNDNHFKYVPFKSLASLSEKVPILTCGGISKTCLIPGLRLGWIVINDRQGIFDQSVRSGLGKLTQRLMGPNSLVQGALQDILTNVPDHFYKKTMDFIFQNAKLCYERLLLVKGLQPYMPQGSMYLMVRFESKMFPTIDGDLDFTSKLMNEESVLVLPGKCFDFPSFFRVCLTVPTNVMEEALNRIKEFCERHAVDLDQPYGAEANKVANLNKHQTLELKQKNHLVPSLAIPNGKPQLIGPSHSVHVIAPQPAGN